MRKGETVDQVANYEPIPVLDKGWIKLDNFLGSSSDIAATARESYKKGTKKVNEDRGLIDRLVRKRHTSPLEMGIIRVRMKAPLFVIAQIVRHRTHSMNQASLRYSEAGLEFYQPDKWRLQDLKNKQSSSDFIDDLEFNDFLDTSQNNLNDLASQYYKYFLEHSVGRELSRILLPQSLYTELVWQQNLHNMLHLLSLRMAKEAQWETRQYANALYHIVQPLFPEVVESWENHVLYGVQFSADEMNLVRKALGLYAGTVEGGLNPELAAYGLNQSRIDEFYEKLEKVRGE